MTRGRWAFVANGDSYEGRSIAAALKENKYHVRASRAGDRSHRLDPLEVDEFIPRDSGISGIVAALQQSQIGFFSIINSYEEAVECLTILNDDPGKCRTVVVVSSMLTWAGEPRTSNYMKRYSHKRVGDFLGAERFLSNSLKRLEIRIMSCGLLYGDGEQLLRPLFEAAWSLNKNIVIDKGRCTVPMLHVRDMGRGAVQVALGGMDVRAFVAHDGVPISQRRLIRSINSYFCGEGRLESGTADDFLRRTGSRDLLTWMTVDLNLEAVEYSGLDFERHCAGGFADEFDLIAGEFLSVSGLSGLRILSLGLPEAFVQQICDAYGVVNATLTCMRELFERDGSQEARDLRESHNEEEAVPISDLEIIKHVLGHSPEIRNRGFVIGAGIIPRNAEDRESLLFDGDDPVRWFPQFVLTKRDPLTETEFWYVSKGAHVFSVRTMEEVAGILGPPHTLAYREERLVARIHQEESEAARLNRARTDEKAERRAAEVRGKEQEVMDSQLLKEVGVYEASRTELAMSTRDYCLGILFPLFREPLQILNAVRPDDPIGFLAAHFESISGLQLS